MTIGDAVWRVDRGVGDRVAGAVRHHHARRLRKIGKDASLGAYAGGWAVDAPPARSGNTLEVLIDGEIVLRRIVEEIRAASSHVYVTAWFLSPDFVMDAGDPVGMGLVQSFARPGGNITGVSAATAELAPKNLELLQQVVPSFKRVALLLNATDPFRKPFLESNKLGAGQLGWG